MKNSIAALLLASILVPCAYGNDKAASSATHECIDQIRAIVFSDKMIVITQSDIERPGLDGMPRSLEDIILENLIFQDARMYKTQAGTEQEAEDEEAVNKYLSAIQREHNLTLDQVKEMFTAAGYTFEEGKKQLNVMQTVNSMLDFKIRSHLIVPEREILKYYEEHKSEAYYPAEYYIERALVPFEEDKGAQYNALKKFAHGKNASITVTWQEPFWIQEQELAQDKAFIKTMAVGDISEPVEVDEGFELFRLANKKERKERVLDDALKNEITAILRQPLFKERFEEYKKSLFDKVAIVYYDEVK